MKQRAHLSQRATFLLASFALLAAAAALPLASASCATQRSAAQDGPEAAVRLRSLTRGAGLPAESVVESIERDYAGTRTGALARVLRARVRAAAGDFTGAAALLDSRDVRERTRINDHALFMRAGWLEQAGRRVEARAAFEQLARDFPDSPRARAATLRAAALILQDSQPSAVPVTLKKLADADDADALLLIAKAYEQSNDPTRALGAYRRLYFYAPVSEDTEREAAAGIARLNSTTAPASAEEAATRADKLFAAGRHVAAANAYADAFARFPDRATPESRIRAGQAAINAKRTPEAVSFLSGALSAPEELRAEAQYNLAKAHARAKSWPSLRAGLEEMRRAHPKSPWTMRALTESGAAARDAKNTADAFDFFRAAVASFPGAPETAGAQFELAWAAHESKNFAESSRLLIEHLADYAGRNTDNRGKAGYWAARDAERAGRTAEARAIYEAMLDRYEANWYGHLSRQRLDQMTRNSGGQARATNFAPDSPVARAVANLKYVNVAEEHAGPAEDSARARAEELDLAGLSDLAHAELDAALRSAPASPRLSLAKARVHRSRGENLEAFRVLARSFPDYSQMEVSELTADEWDIFYPLVHWDAIVQESRARNLDPYTVAGLIRQESVFNPRVSSHADAHGLMQLIPGTARMMARRVGSERAISVEALYDAPFNIKLGTAYLREQLDRFGRIEYVAAAYNAGPGRAVAWRASLPAEMDEWTEAVPFRETRGYVQGVVRNGLQYRRLYDEQGRFRPEVGARAVSAGQAGDTVRARRVANDEEEE
ncbi:MAG TPA: transglycosylase SLT domain-containing protein [Pyrinomonadaceae bacterium]